MKVELDSIIPSSDSFHIPFDVAVFLEFLDIIDVVDHEQSQKDSCTAHNQTKLLLLVHLSRGHDAGHLEEHVSVSTATLRFVETWGITLDQTFEVF